MEAVGGKGAAAGEGEGGGARWGRAARVVSGVVILMAAMPGVATLLGFGGAWRGGWICFRISGCSIACRCARPGWCWCF